MHSAGASGDARRKGAAAMRVAGEGDCVDVHYTCFLDDGTQWDTSRNGDPLNFVIGGGQVIRGFDYVRIRTQRISVTTKHTHSDTSTYTTLYLRD